MGKPKHGKSSRRRGSKSPHDRHANKLAQRRIITGGGYPTAFTAETRAEILGHLAAGMPKYIAAEAAGIADRTLHTWLKRGQALLDAYDAAQAKRSTDPDYPLPDLDAYAQFAYDVQQVFASARAQDMESVRRAGFKDARVMIAWLDRVEPRFNPTQKHRLVREDKDGQQEDAASFLVDAMDAMVERLTMASEGPKDDDEDE